MKPIELTEEHKSKLLEMCKALFPDYDLYISENNIHIGSDFLFIHWFEFCMTYLSIAISKIKNYPADLIDRNEFAKSIIDETYSQHPVDYLYKEFKKLK
jgi:hypothetical protein